MHIDACPYDQLASSKLLRTYTSEFEVLADFFTQNPFDDAQVKERLRAYQFSGDRHQLVQALEQFAEQLHVSAVMKDNCKKLLEPNAITVTTGQQLTALGGPLFTIFKTITAISTARRWSVLTGMPVIPVFWLADEDHDFEEAAQFNVPTYEGVQKLALARTGKGSVGRLPLGESINEVFQTLKSILPATEFSDEVLHLLERCYTKQNSYRQAFAQLMDLLFAKHGLVLAGSDDFAIKQLVSSSIETAVVQASDVMHALLKQSEKLERSGFTAQASFDASQLFYHHETEGRTKIQKEGDFWKVVDTTWSSSELQEEVGRHPERFSPNVFLRPVLQDVLLPNVAYVAGPGELAYYAQMKRVYPLFKLEMPIIIPRFSATILPPAIARHFTELEVPLAKYQQRIEDLEASLLAEMVDVGIWEKQFEMWWDGISGHSAPFISQVEQKDASLKSSAERWLTQTQQELDKLKGKVIKSIKQQEQVKLNRVRRVHQTVWPGNHLQERVYPHIFMLNLFGLDFWDNLLTSTQHLPTNQHYIIRL